VDPAVVLGYLNAGSSVAANATAALVNIVNIVLSLL
jgi:hypothetical protein